MPTSLEARHSPSLRIGGIGGCWVPFASCRRLCRRSSGNKRGRPKGAVSLKKADPQSCIEKAPRRSRRSCPSSDTFGACDLGNDPQRCKPAPLRWRPYARKLAQTSGRRKAKNRAVFWWSPRCCQSRNGPSGPKNTTRSHKISLGKRRPGE
jgi:hypothetical protein